MYGQAVLRTQSNLIAARPVRARSNYYNVDHDFQNALSQGPDTPQHIDLSLIYARG